MKRKAPLALLATLWLGAATVVRADDAPAPADAAPAAAPADAAPADAAPADAAPAAAPADPAPAPDPAPAADQAPADPAPSGGDGASNFYDLANAPTVPTDSFSAPALSGFTSPMDQGGGSGGSLSSPSPDGTSLPYFAQQPLSDPSSGSWNAPSGAFDGSGAAASTPSGTDPQAWGQGNPVADDPVSTAVGANPFAYTVQGPDDNTFQSIGSITGVPPSDLLATNPLLGSGTLAPGTQLALPGLDPSLGGTGASLPFFAQGVGGSSDPFAGTNAGPPTTLGSLPLSALPASVSGLGLPSTLPTSPGSLPSFALPGAAGGLGGATVSPDALAQLPSAGDQPTTADPFASPADSSATPAAASPAAADPSATPAAASPAAADPSATPAAASPSATPAAASPAATSFPASSGAYAGQSGSGTGSQGSPAAPAANVGAQPSPPSATPTPQQPFTPGNGRVMGVDVSTYQADIDWPTAASNGIAFAFVRVSDGLHSDPRFQANWTGTRSANIVRGAYQYFRAGQDPVAQADYICNQCGTLQPGDLPPALDIETQDGQSAATVVARMNTWIAEVKRVTGLNPIIYSSWGFWTQIGSPDGQGCDLWISNWDVSSPKMPSNWSSWAFWQYHVGGAGSVPGIGPGVDMDYFQGSQQDLQNYANRNAPAAR